MKLSIFMMLGVLLACLVSPLAAQNLPVDRTSEPVQVTADRMDADDAAQTLVFAGNAVARQGDISIASDRLTIAYLADGRQMKEIIAEGNVKVTQGERVATGQRAVYDSLEQKIVLSGAPVVAEGPNSVSGDEIVLFLDGRRSLVKGGPDGRVKAVFQPGSGAGE